MSNQHKSIRQPSHDRIQLTHGFAYVVKESRIDDEPPTPFVRVTAQALDANDAIRLAAFLNRFHAEQDAKAEKADAAQDRRRAARQAAARAVK
jgi:hypothetical protein